MTHNWRGDVIGIYSGSGVLTAKYEYDTWGKVKSVKDAGGNRITDQNNVGNLNPFRYRGYYYDTESQLYYLMSRYYDPVTHRFINADGYFQAGNAILDANMNAYCRNNPVNNFDPDGNRCHALEGGRSGPMCPTDFKTGYCNVCHKQECCIWVLPNIGDESGTRSSNSVNYETKSNTPVFGTYSGTTTVVSSESSGGKDVIYYCDTINGSPNIGIETNRGKLHTQLNLAAHDTGFNLGWEDNYVGINMAWDAPIHLRFETGTNAGDTTTYNGIYIDGWGMLIIAGSLIAPELFALFLGSSQTAPGIS